MITPVLQKPLSHGTVTAEAKSVLAEQEVKNPQGLPDSQHCAYEPLRVRWSGKSQRRRSETAQFKYTLSCRGVVVFTG